MTTLSDADEGTRRGRGRLRGHRERGALGALVAVLAPAIIGLAGLVYDGGLALEGRQRADDVAEQAARDAANQCDQDLLRSTSKCVITDLGSARAAAAKYAINGVTITDVLIVPPGDQVEVHTEVTVHTIFLGLFGVNEFHITVYRRATAVTGLA